MIKVYSYLELHVTAAALYFDSKKHNEILGHDPSTKSMEYIAHDCLLTAADVLVRLTHRFRHRVQLVAYIPEAPTLPTAFPPQVRLL